MAVLSTGATGISTTFFKILPFYEHLAAHTVMPRSPKVEKSQVKQA